MPTPLISVIVVCRNPGPRLHDALASLWAQREAIDLIVVDGASTDGTVAWLETQRRRIAHLVSEPDHGVYDAMNKGIALARGEWLFFLGADDRLTAPAVLSEAAGMLRATAASAVVGSARYEDGRLYTFSSTRHAIRKNFVHHQAAFYRRAVFEEKGPFDSGLRYQADYEFNLRLLKAGLVFCVLPLVVSHCGHGGLSDAGHWRNYREEIAIRHRHFPAWRCLLWDLTSILRFIRKNLLWRRHNA